jgi:hypothetical protein
MQTGRQERRGEGWKALVTRRDDQSSWPGLGAPPLFHLFRTSQKKASKKKFVAMNLKGKKLQFKNCSRKKLLSTAATVYMQIQLNLKITARGRGFDNQFYRRYKDVFPVRNVDFHFA